MKTKHLKYFHFLFIFFTIGCTSQQKEAGTIVEEGDEEEAKSDWLLCKITDYNVQSGEHLVCPIDENGIIAGDAVWMVLASQRTKPNEETKKSSDEDVTMETCTNTGALDAEKADEEKRG